MAVNPLSIGINQVFASQTVAWGETVILPSHTLSERGDIVESIKKYMMETSPKVDIIPRLLYHASPKDNHDSITANGILAHKMFGQMYFCEQAEQCFMFTGEDVFVYEVDTSLLEKKDFRVSLDHSQAHFPFECYAYYNDVPFDAVVRVYTT